MPPFSTFSPAEVFTSVVRAYTDPTVVPYVVTGPLSNDQQRAGGISIMDSGAGRQELYVPLIHPRMQLRCVAPSLEEVERIGRHTGFALDAIPGRVEAVQQSTGDTYLVHSIFVSGGPSGHMDSDETWEYLLFVEAMMGTIPVPPA